MKDKDSHLIYEVWQKRAEEAGEKFKGPMFAPDEDHTAHYVFSHPEIKEAVDHLLSSPFPLLIPGTPKSKKLFEWVVNLLKITSKIGIEDQTKMLEYFQQVEDDPPGSPAEALPRAIQYAYWQREAEMEDDATKREEGDDIPEPPYPVPDPPPWKPEIPDL